MAAPMMLYLSIGILSFISVITCFDEEFEGSRTLSLEHSFDQGPDPVFTRRGTIVVKSVQSKKATFSQVATLSSEDRLRLKETVSVDGIYRIRIPVRESGEGTVYISSFTKACAIYESSLSDVVIVSVDQSGEVLGVSMGTAKSCTGLEVPKSNLTDWKTTVELSVTVSGPMPDTQSYIEKIKREEQEKAKGAKTDDRSFLAKYWMYIVPFVLFMFVMQNVDPNQAGGGGR